MAHPLLPPEWGTEVRPTGVGDGMTRYAHSSSKIAVALLALAAACGSGQPAQGTGSNKFLRMQDPAELDSENGLISIGLNCLALDSVDLTVSDPSLLDSDPSLLDLGFDGAPLVGVNSCGNNLNGMPPSLLHSPVSIWYRSEVLPPSNVPDAQCSGVYPGPSAFGSAPCSSRNMARST